LHQLGTTLRVQGDTEGASVAFRQCADGFESVAASARDFRNAAVCAAQAGEQDRAFAMLEKLAEKGLRDPEALRTDEGLTALHDDPRWKTLFSRLNQK
jgi:hypothetical protein